MKRRNTTIMTVILALTFLGIMVRQFREVENGPTFAQVNSRSSRDTSNNTEISPDERSQQLRGSDREARRTHHSSPIEAADAPAPLPEGEDPVKCFAYGRITIDPDDPIPNHGFTVRLTDREGNQYQTKADSEGRYSKPGLSPGDWWIFAEGVGYEREVDVLPFSADKRLIRRDFHLTRSLFVDIKLITPDGRPFQESLEEQGAPLRHGLSLRPVATKNAPGEFIDGVRGNESSPFGAGQFWKDGHVHQKRSPEYLGSIFLQEQPPLFLSLLNFQYVIETRLVEAGTTEITFVLRPEDLIAQLGQIRAEFVDLESDRLLPDVQVWLQGGPRGGSARFSNTDGQVYFDSIPPGNYSLCAELDGYALFVTPLQVQPARVTQPATITLEKEVTVSGHVTKKGKSPLHTELQSSMIDPDTGKINPTMHRTTQFGDDGSFTIEGMARGKWAIWVGDQGDGWMSPRTIVDTSGGSLQHVTLTVYPTHSIVVIPPLDRWKELQYTVSTEQGIKPSPSRFYSPSPSRIQVAPGAYLVQILTHEGILMQEWSIMTSEKPLTLRIE